MKKSFFYHAGCSVCVSADIKFVPALVTPNGNVLHINFGASIEDLINHNSIALTICTLQAKFGALLDKQTKQESIKKLEDNEHIRPYY